MVFYHYIYDDFCKCSNINSSFDQLIVYYFGQIINNDLDQVIVIILLVYSKWETHQKIYW